MRGRKPKPTYLRMLDGNASHSRIPNPQEPEPSGDLADPPHELDARQAAIWRYAIEHAPPGMLKLIDRSLFAAWVSAVATFELARERVTALGLLLKSEKGTPYQNPYLSIQNRQAALIRQMAGDLGFSPTSRPRVKADQPKKGPNPFEVLKSFDQ